MSIQETCSVCSQSFDVQFRYQMEERNDAFAFFCSQKCLEQSQCGESDDQATCDACAKRYSVTLASQVFYLKGRRVYACAMPCRAQLIREADGMRLGQLLSAPPAPSATPAPPAVSAPIVTPLVRLAVPSVAQLARPRSGVAALSETATVVPVMPALRVEQKTPSPAPVHRETPRILAIFNHKGGTGKTTTAVSVAAGLALKGKRVLIVDTDAQGNVAVSLNAPSERSLYHVLVMGLRVSDAVTRVRENLDLLASNETLAAAELYLAGRQNRDRVLRDRLAAAAAGYDYVVVDCSPSLSLMNQNALVFADSVLVPVACDYLSLVGVRQVIKTVKNVNQLLHHPVQIWGVLPTLFDARANICHDAVSTLRDHFGDRCLEPVRAAIKVKEAPAQGQTIFEYAAGASAADDYQAVVDRIVREREAQHQPLSPETATTAPAAAWA